jgi:nitric oxide reductase NorQ protein
MRLIVQDGATALLLEGAHGGGKSDLAAFIAMMLGRELEIITFDGQVDVGDLMGRWVLQQGEMVWRDGKIPRAMKSGAILRVDEINAAPAEINIVFNDIADGKPYYSREADELIVPDPGFRLIGTMNPHLEYAGTHALNAATLDRFTRVEVRYPSKAMERTRLRLNFPSIRDEDLDVLLDLAERNREQKANDPSREYVISPRALVKTCRQMEHANFSLADAIRYGIIEKAAYFGAEIADALKADVTAMIAARAQQP